MMQTITDVADLRAIYPDAPTLAATVKVAHRLTPAYRAWIEAAPFCALATAGPEGLDCSPRGDDGPVVRVIDDTMLALPDRRGNNRIDSLLNILRDPRVALMFLIPGSGTVIRVNGRAAITADDALCRSFAREGAAPRSVVLVSVGEVYFQCARAVLRAGLWRGAPVPAGLPAPGAILEELSAGGIDGAAYDAAWPARAAKTMW
jgi:PPOX class probable FMN-dependent enzyme